MSALREPEPEADAAEDREARRLQLVETVTARIVEEEESVEQASTEVRAAIAQAQAIEIQTPEDRAAVGAMLQTLKARTSDIENRRRHLKQPHLEGGRRVDKMFKELREPLDAADKELRRKLLAYDQEQDRLRAAEQARIDREREEREAAAAEEQAKAAAEAQAAREAAERERALADAAARRVEQRQQQRDTRGDNALAAAAKSAPVEVLQRAAERPDRYGEIARAELAERERDQRAHREAKEQQAAANAAADAARAAEQSARAQPAPVVPRAEVAAPKKLAGIARKRRRVMVVDDLGRVPREYLVLDTRRAREALFAGADIPGLRIEWEEELEVRAA